MEGNTKVIVICDCQGEKLARVKTITPSFVRDSIRASEAFPIRVQAFHFVNVPVFFEPLINTAKSLMRTSKMASRVRINVLLI